MSTKRMQAFLTEDLIFDLPTGKDSVLTSLKGISYQLISDKSGKSAPSN